MGGQAAAFLTALGVVLVWAITGPLFHYSDTWQLVINTGTTIVTFLMVFLIQNTQNRDTLALQIKLSELIVAVKGADNKLAAIDDATDEELERAHEKVSGRSLRKTSVCERTSASRLPCLLCANSRRPRFTHPGRIASESFAKEAQPTQPERTRCGNTRTYASCSIVTATSALAESRTWVPSTSAMRLESMK